jgi:FkbM family methyltransferase
MTQEDIRSRIQRRTVILRFILEHPVNRGHRLRALARYAGWQGWRRIVRRPITVNFWNGLRVRVLPDLPYSWTAIYFGLAEYDDMMFTLRYLRPGDAFIDVGANIGFYSLLASSVNAGAPVLAYEPHPVASGLLRENANLNSFGNIRVREVAAGSAADTARLTSDLGERNRIVAAADRDDRSVQVRVVMLDDELIELGIDPASVALVKIDTEGFEANVLKGARRLLDARPGPVWMVELTKLGARYGSDDAAVYAMFAERGYQPVVYVADDNRFDVHEGSEAGNLIFAREPEAAAARLSAGRLVSV